MATDLTKLLAANKEEAVLHTLAAIVGKVVLLLQLAVESIKDSETRDFSKTYSKAAMVLPVGTLKNRDRTLINKELQIIMAIKVEINSNNSSREIEMMEISEAGEILAEESEGTHIESAWFSVDLSPEDLNKRAGTIKPLIMVANSKYSKGSEIVMIALLG